MPWYRVGSVAITAGQTTVTGTGTAFSANSRVGDALQGPDGRWYEVTNIPSATVLSILPAYQGATVANGTYGLAPMQGYVKESADRLRQLVEQFGGTLAVFGGATDAPTLREKIGAATRGENSDITSLSGMTTALSVPQGGTGGKTPAEARDSLGLVFQTSAVDTTPGRILSTGSYGLGGSVQVVGGNVGDFRPNGFYHIMTSSTPGSPNGENGILKQWSAPGDPNFRILEYLTWSGRRFTLTMSGGAWSASGWRESYSTGNTTRAADGTLKAI